LIPPALTYVLKCVLILEAELALAEKNGLISLSLAILLSLELNLRFEIFQFFSILL